MSRQNIYEGGIQKIIDSMNTTKYKTKEDAYMAISDKFNELMRMIDVTDRTSPAYAIWLMSIRDEKEVKAEFSKLCDDVDYDWGNFMMIVTKEVQI